VVRPFPFSNTTSANYPTLVYAQSYNAVQLIAKGYDVEASYRHPLLGGQLNLHALATYQYEYDSQTSPIVPLVNSAGYITAGSTPSPKLIANASIGYKKGAFGINVQERRIGSWSLAAPPGTLGTISYFQNPTVAAVHYTDLNLTYDFKVETAKRLQAYFNVNNLFDKAPPLLPPTNNPGITYPTQRSLYNVVMRDFTAGVRFQF
jgi:outer membrane receptor protein involved in Fe transport